MSLDLQSLLRMLGRANRRPAEAGNQSNPLPIQSTGFAEHELGQMIEYQTNLHSQPINESLFNHLRLKKSNLYPSVNQSSSQTDLHFSSRFIPNYQQSINHFNARAFCTQFSADGKTFVVATQDNQLHLYDTVDALCEKVDESDQSINQSINQSEDDRPIGRSASRRSSSPFQPFKQIAARHVNWSIIDVDYSPNSEFVAYSTWSPYVQLCNVFGSFELHEACDMQPGNLGRFCFFSIKFAPSGRTVLGGASDGCWYLFDIERKQRLLCVSSHSDDINTVCFTDASGDVLCTGSDDRTIRVWDVRVCGNSPTSEHGRNSCQPVGSFLGHSEGITCVTSAYDGRLIASNGKDQCLKVWDLRCMRSASDADEYEREPTTDYDYRYGGHRSISNYTQPPHAWDTSLATMRGHRIAETLVRCHFSPSFTTANRYIYTGSYRGSVFIYDCLTGEVVTKLQGHGATVRDCSWHPTEPIMLTASWDNSVGLWTYSGEIQSTSQSSDQASSRADHDPAVALFADDDESDDDAEDPDYLSHEDSDEAPDDDMDAQAAIEADERKFENMDDEEQDDEDFDDEDEDDEDEDDIDIDDIDDDTFSETIMSLLANAMMSGIDPSRLIERINPNEELEEKVDGKADENEDDK